MNSIKVNPRKKPAKSARASAPEGRFPPISPKTPTFPAASLAPEGMPAPHPFCHSERSAAKSKNLLLAMLANGWDTTTLNRPVHQERSVPRQFVLVNNPVVLAFSSGSKRRGSSRAAKTLSNSSHSHSSRLAIS